MAPIFCSAASLAKKVKAEIRVVLIDIEGTTTPISFVTETLFPYAKDNVQSYLTEKWDQPEVREDVDALRQLARDDASSGTDAPAILPEDSDKESVIQSVVKNVHWQISNDRKVTALKQLQGHMWRGAYEDGKIKSEIFTDVPDALRSLRDLGKKLYVYSSGSVEAQKLLFKHSDHGDLTDCFDGYFDTKIGSKRESQSYSKIATEVKGKPEEILFLTDVGAEGEAARESGVNVCLLIRSGNKPLTEKELKNFLTIPTFDLLIDTEDSIPEKRQKTD